MGIAIYEFRGYESPAYKYELADGTVICDGGSVHAIDLRTGYTLWQWKNPYSITEEDGCDDIVNIHEATLRECNEVSDCWDHYEYRCELGYCMANRFHRINEVTCNADDDCKPYERETNEKWMVCEDNL